MCPTRTKSGIANVRPLPWRLESRLVLGLGLGAVLILGAIPLDDAVSRLDELDRSARQGAEAAAEAKDGRTKLTALALELAAQAREVQALEAQAGQTAAALSSARAHRISYLVSLARER